MKKTLIIIPAFNEEQAIGKVLNSLKESYPDYDLLVIDDASKDNTIAEVEKVASVRVLKLSVNIGYGAALQTGYKYALWNNYDYLVQLDADGQHDIKGVSELTRAVIDDECDIALGSRFLGSADYQIGSLKLFGIKLFSFITRLITKQKITDPTSGFQGMNKKALEFYASDIYPSDFPDADVIIASRLKGLMIKEFPVNMHQAISGHSMHHGLIALYYIFKMFLSIIVTLLRKKSELEEV